jgi:hypothetical protein
VIRGGGRGYYTLVRLTASLLFCYPDFLCWYDLLASSVEAVAERRFHHIISLIS